MAENKKSLETQQIKSYLEGDFLLMQHMPG